MAARGCRSRGGSTEGPAGAIEAVYRRTLAELAARESPFWMIFAPLAVDATPEAIPAVVRDLRERTTTRRFDELAVAMAVLADADARERGLTRTFGHLAPPPSPAATPSRRPPCSGSARVLLYPVGKEGNTPMANGYGFSALSQHTIAGLRESIEQGPWATIKTARYEQDDERPTNLLDAPRLVQWKLQLKWPLGRLMTALASGGSTDALDRAWDRAQRRLDAQVTVAENDDDEAVVAAARRVRKAMLKGSGTAQTQLPQPEEVAFGRTQVRLAKQKPLADDVARLGLGPALAAVQAATEELAKGLGIPEGAKRPLSPAERVRAAGGERSVGALNDVMRGMDWHLAHLPEGPAREQVTALRATLALLLDQSAAGGSAEEEPAAPEPDTPAPA